jgi:hypothetical protein
MPNKEIPASLASTMAVDFCPDCRANSVQLTIWSYKTAIAQYCFECQTFVLNDTIYTRTTSKHQRTLAAWIRDANVGTGTIRHITDVPVETTDLLSIS